MTAYGDWLKSEIAVRCVLVEAVASVAGTDTTFYMSDRGYVDSVANREYPAVIIGSLTTNEELSLDGQGSMSYGGIEIDNTNGDRDAWLNHIWVNRAVSVYFGDATWTKSSFELVFSGVIDNLQVKDRNTLGLAIVDKLQRLNCPVSDVLLGGSTENRNELIPLAFGEVCNVTPLLTNPATHEYQYHSGASERLIEVRYDGVPITGYTSNLSTGKFTLTVAPWGSITCSVQGDKPSAYTDKIAGTIKRIVKSYGKASTRFTDADIDLTNFSDFDTAHTQAVGIYLNSRENVISVIQQLADSVGAQAIMQRDGTLALYQISLPPNGTPYEITQSDMVLDSFNLSSRIPVKAAVKLGYCKNWTVQNNLQSGIPDAHKELFGREYLAHIETDVVVAAAYKLSAEPIQSDTLLLVESEASTEATRRLGLWSSPRMVVAFNGFANLMSLHLGDAVSITHPRFGLSSGKSGIVTKLATDWLKSTVGVEVLGFDTVALLSYAIAPNVTTVNEGGSVVFTVTTGNIPDGTVLYWTTLGGAGITYADFVDNVLTGSVTINSSTASMSRYLKNDFLNEGTETFQLQIRTGSIAGTVVATSAVVSVNDTSQLTPSVINLISLGAFGSGFWNLNDNITTASDFGLAPDGTNTAAKISATISSFARHQANVTANVTADGKITYRIFVKDGYSAAGDSQGKAGFLLRNVTTGTNLCGMQLTFATGVNANYFGTSAPFDCTDVGNGWYRITITVSSGVSTGQTISLYCGFCGEPRTAGDYMLMWAG